MEKQKFQPVIGLEIHVELQTNSKMFCSCPNDFNLKPNVNICPVCLGHPGTLPVINQEGVKKVIKVGLALNCKIAKISKFDRKNYFYPDIPKGYQISQYDMPLCEKGFLEVMGKKVRITRVHLEEDAGKLIHSKEGYSLVDFNRAGVPLMELVTEPDIRSAEEAVKFAKELQLILRCLGISDADMEKGHMRIEVNISLSRKDKIDLSNIRTEIKNLNSFKAVEGAIHYETKRQTEVLNNNEKVIQETRGWEESKGETVSQRKKEEAHDYRYLPDPDLPILAFTDQEINEIKESIPELPQQKRKRFVDSYNLKDQESEFFIQNPEMSSFFENTVSFLKEKVSQNNFDQLINLTINYLTTDVKGLMNKIGKKIIFSPNDFAEFILLLGDKKISSKIAKNVLEKMFNTGKGPSFIIQKEGLSSMDDDQELEVIIENIILKNKKAVTDFKSGKENVLQFLIGQVMAHTKGRANLKKVENILKDKIKN